MAVPLFQIDAFTREAFGGNPAAVCLLAKSADAGWMQAVAAEMNLSETAFVSPIDGGFALRWFTPEVEVELCGHATLASACALWSSERVPVSDEIRFSTQSGWLTARRSGSLIELDFPATPAKPLESVPDLERALGVQPQWIGKNDSDFLIVLESEETVRQVAPNFPTLAALTSRGAIVTSRAEKAELDFVSRFFAPAAGIDEDPVTGSAHCTLAPYWGAALGKTELTGFQASARGGTVQMDWQKDRVLLRGDAVIVMRGELVV